MASVPSFFCSDLSRRNKELMYGTASTTDYWLLLEYTQQWTDRAITKNNLPHHINQYLSEVLDAVQGSRLLFIKRSNRSVETLHLFIISCKELLPFTRLFYLNSYEDLLNLDLKNVIPRLDNSDEGKYTERLFLVCTDGQHDKCCAKYGFSIFQTLRKTLGERAWQCTHVGGDRFAANLICFPHGIYYGHVEESDVPEIISSYDKNRIYLKTFRGRACFSRYVQVGECFVREKTGLMDLSALEFIDQDQIAERTWRVRFISGDDHRIHKVTFAREESHFTQYPTCRAESEEKVNQYYLLTYEVDKDLHS